MILWSLSSQIRPFRSWLILYQTHSDSIGVAEVEDISGQVNLKEGGKNHKNIQLDVVVYKGGSGVGGGW